MLSTEAKTIPEAAVPAPIRNNWILGPARDFWLLHGGCGLIVTPILVLGFLCPDSWTAILVGYALLLGWPHISATHTRLVMDAGCHRFHLLLGLVAPVAVASVLFAAIVVAGWLP